MPPGVLRVLAILPGAPANADADYAALQGAAAGNIEIERLADCSENGLRRRLAQGGIDILHFIGGGKANAAAHYAVLEFNASGGGVRTVNARHVGSLLAQQPSLQLVVLQARDAGVDLSAMALPLREAGVPAVLTTGPMRAQTGAFARRFYSALAAGDTPQLAMQTAQAVFVADPAQSAAIHLTAAEPERSFGVPQPVAAAPAPAPAASPGAAPDSDAVLDPIEAQRQSRAQQIQQTLERKRAAGEFDVFLCHNGADKPAVRSIAQALKARGLLPWLDQWELPPGQPWQPLLEKQIARIRSAAVFVGRAGVGPWQEQELYGFLREFVSRHAPVIPVLLPDAPATPELPIFLKAMTYVDFRVSDPDPLARLEWGITGVRPERD